MDEAFSPDALPNLPDLSPVGAPIAVPAAPPLPTPPGGTDARSRLMTLAMLASAIGVGKHNGGAGLLGGFLNQSQQQDEDKQKKYQFDVQEQQRQQALVERAQQAEAERQARAAQQRNTALGSISKIVQTLTDKKQYDSFIDMAGNQLMLAGYRDLSPNALRVNFRYVAPSAEKLAGKKLDEILGSPLTKAAMAANPDKVVNGTIDFDANGDGIPEKVTITELAKMAGRPLVMDGMTGKPIIPDKKEGPVGTAFQELLKASREQFMAENQRPPKPTEDSKLIAAAMEKSKEKPTDNTTTNDAKEIAAAIIDGTQPPDMRGMYSKSAAVRAELHRNGYDLRSATIDWEATKKFISTANNAQQLKMRQNIETASHSLDVIEDLSNQWKAGRFPLLNKGRLMAAKSGAMGPQAQSIASQLEGQINDVVSELGGVYMGGNSPTDHALALAKSNLSADWSQQTLNDMIKLARTNLQIRNNSMIHSGPVGVADDRKETPVRERYEFDAKGNLVKVK